MVAALLFLVLHAAAESPCLDALMNDALTLKDAFTGKSNDFSPLIRFWYTGRDINDLGHYQSCVDRDDSEYFVLKFKDTDFPTVLGVCAPKGCSAAEVREFFEDAEESGVYLETQGTSNLEAYAADNPDLTVGGWLFIVFILMLASLAVTGTIMQVKAMKVRQESSMQLQEFTTTEAMEAPLNMDIMTAPQQPQTPTSHLISAFSLTRSYQLLSKNNSSHSILPLNGVRVMAVGWVILGQLFSSRVQGIIIDLEDIEDVSTYSATAIGYGATTGINTLFWLTGFLAGLGMLGMLETKGHIDWKSALGYRVFRLLPVLAFCLAFNNLVLPAIGFGPQWNDFPTNFTEDCGSYWWTNLLALNNVIPDGAGNFCYFSSWAVAVNFQLFTLAPFLVLLYLHKTKVFVGIVVGLSIAALTITAIVAGVWEVDVNYLDSVQLVELALYNKPYFHLLPFLTGLYLSVVFYMFKQGETNSDPVARLLLKFYANNSRTALISFGLGLLLLNLNIFGQIGFYADDSSRAANVFYLTQAQLSDALSLSLILLPILMQGLPKVAKVLSLAVWGPLARLSFCAYMMHEGVMRALIKGEQTGFYWTNMSIFNDFCFNFVVSYLAALPVFFLVEGPCYSLLSQVASRSVKKH